MLFYHHLMPRTPETDVPQRIALQSKIENADRLRMERVTPTPPDRVASKQSEERIRRRNLRVIVNLLDEITAEYGKDFEEDPNWPAGLETPAIQQKTGGQKGIPESSAPTQTWDVKVVTKKHLDPDTQKIMTETQITSQRVKARDFEATEPQPIMTIQETESMTQSPDGTTLFRKRRRYLNEEGKRPSDQDISHYRGIVELIAKRLAEQKSTIPQTRGSSSAAVAAK